MGSLKVKDIEAQNRMMAVKAWVRRWGMLLKGFRVLVGQDE
jgi:hypothetical protein